MKTKKVIAALSVLCSALTCGISQASIVSVDWTGTNSVYSIDSRTFVMGYSFSVTSMVTVGFLGAFDNGGNGLNVAHAVGLWDSTGTLLTSGTVQSGTSDPLFGHFRFTDVADVVLVAGQTYSVGAADYGLNEAYAYHALSLTAPAGITYLKDRLLETAGLVNPTDTQNLNQGNAWFGGTVGVIPEPATPALVALALAGLALSRRKRAA